MTLLSALNIDVTFQVGPPWRRISVPALRGINIDVEPGEIIGVVGESGSGKSTLGNVFVGTQRPTSGSLTYKGQPISEVSIRERAGKFAAVLQHPKLSLNPMLRLRDSILEPLKIIGRAGNAAERRATAGKALEKVGLEGNYQDRFPGELSGGQRQRVSIARALITDPEFVLFDEAVSALDVSVQSHVLNTIRSLQAGSGFSAIFISHDLAATRYVTDKIAVLYAGRLVEFAPSDDFRTEARHPYSRGLQFASGLVDNPAFELKLGSGSFPQHGCPVHDRCPLTQDICHTDLPATRKVENSLVQCHIT